MTRVVVIAWGNDARGDDGIGPALAAVAEGLSRPGVTVIEDYQLQIEHALDVAAADLVLFVDAARDGPSPFFFRETAAGGAMTPFSHALSPEAVLSVCERTNRSPAPPSFVLGVRGESFVLGDGPSAAARANLAAAERLLRFLLDTPDADSWRRAATGDRPVATV